MFSNSNGEIYNYAYNADGIRTQKNVFNANGDFTGSTEYIYDGTKLIAENRGGDWLYYFYDANSTVTGMYYNNVLYYFRKNLQGDITGIYNANGNIIAQYEYTPYGAILSITDANGNDISTNATHIANINPFRYKGYYYDTDTGFYYLITRYYDPVVGRFINADSQLNIGEGVLGCNMYTYCLNNPVNGYDPCGTCFHRWDFWNDCDKCGGKNLGTKIGDAASAVGSAVVSAGKAVSNAVVSAGKAVGNAAVSAWDWTKEAAQTAWGGVKVAGKAVGNFVVDRFSTPEKASNTLCVIGFALDFAATYCGLVAIGLSIPTLGMSIPTAGTAAAILATASLAFYGAALVIEIYNEE